MTVEVCKAKARFISDAVGNGLIATEDIDGGEVIIRIKNPCVLIPENRVIINLCYGCLSRNKSLNTCSGCKIVRYCSKTCQAESWRDIHKLECKIFRKGKDEGRPLFPTPVRGLMQMLLRHPSGVDPDAGWFNLKNHREMFMTRDKLWADIKLQAWAALYYTGLPMTLMDIATSILCAFKVNAFNATEPDDTPIGLCFEPLFAKANHSCVANAFISFDGRHVSFKALKPIRTGDEITIYYVDTNQLLDKRRCQLEDNYYFTCKCPKCIGDWNVYTTFLNNPCHKANEFWLFNNYEALEIAAQNADLDDINRVSKNYESTISAVTRAIEEDTPQQIHAGLKLAQNTLGIVNSSKSIAVTPYPTVLNALIDNYCRADEIEAALILLIASIFHVQPYEFPEPWHPVRITRLHTAATLISQILGSSKYPLQRLAAIPPATVSEVEFFPCIYAVLLLVATYAPCSHGESSNFLGGIASDLADIEQYAIQQRQADILAMRKLGIREGPGRLLALKYFLQLEKLADVELVFKIIETVDCAGGGHR